MGEPLLQVSNLSIAYDKTENIVVDDFHLQVDAGKIVAIVGESGSGKTSVIRGIMGILNPMGILVSGEVRFQDQLILEDKKYKKGCDMSFVFQNSGAMMNPVLTIGHQFIEYIRVHKKMSKKMARNLAIETMEKVQLTQAELLMNAYPFELSGGMQQRVGVAMAIAFQPKLILADEPTSALDVTNQIQILELLKKINKESGTAMIMVTHNLGAAAFLADECVVMLDGKIVERNNMQELIRNPQHDYTKKLIGATVLEEVKHDR